MKAIKVLILCSITFLFLFSIGLTKEFKYISQGYGDSSLAVVSANTPTSCLFNFTPPENVEHVQSVNIKAFYEATTPVATTLNLTVNGSSNCNVNNVTFNLGKTQVVADFYCTNLINASGHYNVTLTADQTINNLRFECDVLYITNPKGIKELNNIIDLSSNIKNLPITDQYCVSENLKKVEYYAVVEIDGESIEVSYEQNFTCAYGCVNATDVSGYGECLPPSSEQYQWIIIFIFVILTIVFVVRYISKRV